MKNSKFKKPAISVFFPAHNEEANIERVVKATLDVLKDVASSYEVVVVNDGSKDRTGEIAENLAKKDKHVHVAHHEVNKGYGAALISGIKACKLDYIFFTDSDCQFDLSEMRFLIPYLETYDIVVGYRIKRMDPFMRKVNAFGWNTLVKLLFRIPVRDIDCAFKIFKREVFDKVFITAHGAMISTEIMAKAHNYGFTIKEVGVHHYPRLYGEQSGAKLKVILRAFWELFKLYRKL